MSDVLKRAMALHVKIVLGTDAVAGSHGRNAEDYLSRKRRRPAADGRYC